MQFLIFKEEKFYASCTLKDKNFAPKQNERDCPMTEALIYKASRFLCLQFWKLVVFVKLFKIFFETLFFYIVSVER